MASLNSAYLMSGSSSLVSGLSSMQSSKDKKAASHGLKTSGGRKFPAGVLPGPDKRLLVSSTTSSPSKSFNSSSKFYL